MRCDKTGTIIPFLMRAAVTMLGGRSVSSAGQWTGKAFRAGKTGGGEAGNECIPHRDYIPHHSRRVAWHHSRPAWSSRSVATVRHPNGSTTTPDCIRQGGHQSSQRPRDQCEDGERP
jgi:hypothetical protein